MPSIAKFTPELKKALGGVMPKAGQQAGEEYSRGFAQSAVSGIERASAQLAAARKKEADAAGAVRVAEAKLQDLRATGKAKTGQLVTAEENLARAHRTLDANTDAVTRSTRELSAAEERATRETNQLDAAQGRASRSGGLLSRSFGGLTSGAKLLVGSLIGGGIIAGFRGLYDAAAESAKIGRLTEQVIRSTGGAAHVSAEQVGDLATAISNKTGVDDEAIQSGQNLLLTFTNVRNEVGKGNDIFNRATQLATDMSVALGTDTAAAARQLGKALNDPIAGLTTLRRLGVSFTAEQKEQITTLVESGHTMEAQQIILDELARKFGGAAEAAGTPFEKLQVQLGNVAEELGGYLIPVVDAAAGFIVNDLIPAGRDAAAWFGDNFGPAVHVAGDALGVIVSVGKGVAEFFGSLPGPLQAAVIALGAVVLLKGPVSGAFISIRDTASGAVSRIVGASTSMGALKAAGGGLVGFFGGPWGLAIAGATAALSLLVGWLGDSGTASEDAASYQRDLAAALRESKGAIDENVRAIAAQQAIDQQVGDSNLLAVAEQLGLDLPTVTDALLGNRDAYNELTGAANAYYDQSLLAENAGDPGFTRNAENARLFIGALDELAPSLAITRENERLLAGATAETGTASDSAQVAIDAYATELEDAKTAADEAKQSTDLFKLSLDILSGATVTMGEVEAAFWASVAQADGALENMSGTVLDAAGNLNVQSEAGRAAQDVLFGVRDSGNQLIATMIQQGATAEEVNAKDAQLRESFIHTAMQMGISEQAAWALTEQIFGIPSERETKINADVAQARGDIAATQSDIDNMHGRTLLINVRAHQSLEQQLGRTYFGQIPEFDIGGYTGPGSRSRPAGIVHAGEVVWSQDDVAAHGGPQRVEAMRRTRRGYAGGGIVGADLPINVDINDDGLAAGITGALDALAKRLEPATGMFGALQWARTQVGKPYLWGGVGPTGYDCSGFMSALTNIARGRSPYSRVGSTATFPWAGFAPGYGTFTIGSTPNAGGGVGHMAGTLLNVSVESAGGVGVRVGGSARGASDGLFSTRAHLLDEGGLWPPGWGFNATGDIERVLTPEQDDYFRRFVDTAGRLPAPGPTRLEGDLYLSSGEFMGKVQGVVVSVMDDRDRLAERDLRAAR